MSSNTVSIANDDRSLVMTFYPEVGGSIGSLVLKRGGQEVDVLRAYDPSVPLHEFNMASFPMVPMCGRTDHGKFVFEGKTYHVGPPSEGEPHPNHGNGRSQPWTVVHHGDNKITMELASKATGDMPYDYFARQTIELDGNMAKIDMSVRNDGDSPRPFGIGHHLYYARTPETLFGFSADYVWRSENMIPQEKMPVPPEFDFSVPKAIDPSEQREAYGNSGTAYMDHCFGGYGGKTTVSQPENGITTIYTCSDTKNFISFIPSDAPFICCFAASNMPDGFNRHAKGEQDTGTRVLKPQETLSLKMALEIS